MKTMKQIPEVLMTQLYVEEAISLVKTTFEEQLKNELQLYKISAPMIVLKGTGVNDDLNGIDRPVKFPLKSMKEQPAEVVQSLAKWKRLRLEEYKIQPGTGILTDMRALRADESLSPIHSISVDQWDWEKVIFPEERKLDFLKDTVRSIYAAILSTEKCIADKYPEKFASLPEDITFIHAEELLQRFPNATPKEREDKAAKEFGAIFIIGIGGELSNGEPHDDRAPDYDDWSTKTTDGFQGLNGDIIFWNPVLEKAFEISSMGIRVDPQTLERQLEFTGHSERRQLYYHHRLLKGELPLSIGGGIGQSRLCMFLLKKSHIAEVQVSIWPESMRESYRENGINFL